MRATTMALFATLIASFLLLPGCKKTVDQATFKPDGTLDWAVTIKEGGEHTLLLGYELEAPYVDGEGDFELEGTASIATGQVGIYEGPLWVSSDKGPTTPASRSVQGQINSTGNRCTVSYTSEMYTVGNLSTGTELKVKARVPMKNDTTTVTKVWVELKR